MQNPITDAERWQWFNKFWNDFKGDVFKYDDGSVGFWPHQPVATVGGKDLQSFVDKMIRKEQKK